jgi:hypothetical protein
VAGDAGQRNGAAAVCVAVTVAQRNTVDRRLAAVVGGRVRYRFPLPITLRYCHPVAGRLTVTDRHGQRDAVSPALRVCQRIGGRDAQLVACGCLPHAGAHAGMPQPAGRLGGLVGGVQAQQRAVIRVLRRGGHGQPAAPDPLAHDYLPAGGAAPLATVGR